MVVKLKIMQGIYKGHYYSTSCRYLLTGVTNDVNEAAKFRLHELPVWVRERLARKTLRLVYVWRKNDV